MSFIVTQNLFLGHPSTITVVKCEDLALSMEYIQPLLDATDTILGVAATYGKHCQISSIAFSTLSRALVVTIPASHIPQPKALKKQKLLASRRSLLEDYLLLNPTFRKYAFTMDQLAVALHVDLSLRIDGAVDMLSLTKTRHTLDALMRAMGGESILHKQNVKSLFFSTSKVPAVDPAAPVVLQAWAACRAASEPPAASRFTSLPRINTAAFSNLAHLDAIATISRHAELLDALKPTVTKNDVKDQFTTKKDAINLECSRFSTRIRKSYNQFIQVEVEGKGVKTNLSGRARGVKGRSAKISVDGPVRGDRILSVTTYGKGDPTPAESTRRTIILETLKHKTNILFNPFFQAFWFPNERQGWPEWQGLKTAIPIDPSCTLNVSQRVAVKKILSYEEDDRIVLIQGPPGTGKTTVIAASVISHHHAKSGRCIWVAAQSNVAVKNIAEKFAKLGFLEFKIFVSFDFHFDWHEHLYEKLAQRVIRSDNLKGLSPLEASRMLLDCKVILCTLSGFSTSSTKVLRKIVPVEVIILDEASQIECGDYLPVFYLFHSTLSKVILIGDDKQLPPYGQENISDLRSVFEFSHLRRGAVFLRTQYRMPHVIGNFISQNVYGGKLDTVHHSKTSKACCFVDVSKGQEEKHGRSWINREEARIVVKLAQIYESKGVFFRIITPYDSQRSLLENSLKAEGLKWEDKVFNVDSFQGNEDDHIIISVVRSDKLGFLRNERRSNVMLTRCKQSMVICSSRTFLLGEASDTLMGKLAFSLDEKNWISANDVLNGKVQLT